MKERFIALFMVLMLMFQLVPAAVLSEETPAPTEVPYSGGIGSNVVSGKDYAKVTFIGWDGTELSVLNVQVGQPIGDLPAVPEREGFAAAGWKTEAGEEVTKDTVVKADMKVIASYLGDADGDAALRVLDASVDGDGVLISIAGAIPEGLNLSVTKEEEAPRKKMLFKAMGGPDLSDRPLYTYDISLTGEDGTKYQLEDGPVLVTVQGQKFEEALATGRSIRLTHYLDDGTAEEITDLQVNADTVTFSVDHFSGFSFTGAYDLVGWESALSAGDVDVALSGSMPRGAQATAELAAPAVTEGAVLAAADITLLNAGVEVEPASWGDSLMVTMTNEAIAHAIENGTELSVWHIGDDGYQTRLDNALVTVSASGVTFPAEEFSVYAVVGEGEITHESRMTVNFWNGTKKIAFMYIKNSDDTASEIEQILHDPGVGDVPNNSLFKGWRRDEEAYTTADAANNAMSIDQIRAWALDKANNNEIFEGEVHNFYAMIFQTYSVSFFDEERATIHGEALIFKPDETVTYLVNTPYTPKDQNSQFQGWYATTANDGQQVTTLNGNPIGTQETGPIPNGTTVVIYGDTAFAPKAPKGYWLTFNSNTEPNTSRASYTPPQFIMQGAVTTQPAEPTRIGYRFDGWYENAACTGQPFVFGRGLGQPKELFAKWTAVPTANYTVIIWQQNVDATGYDFVESITLSGTTNSQINTVSQQGTGNGAYARVNGVNKTYTGFQLKEFDQNVTIKPEGDSLLNVYYDRTEYTLRFFYARSYTYNNHTYNQVCVNNEGFLQGRANNRNLNNSLTYRGANDYQLLDGSNTWKDVGSGAAGLVLSSYTSKPEVTTGSIGISNVRTDVVSNSNSSTARTVNMTYYYFDVKVRYGQSLEELWPVPNNTFSNQTMTSYNRGNGNYSTVRPLLQGSWATGKNIGGLYGQMTTNLFVGTDTTAYFITYWRYENSYQYRYNVYFSTLEGETAQTTYKGKGYVLQDDLSYTVANGQGWGNTSLTDSGRGYWDVENVTFDGTDLVGRVDVQSTGTINVYYDRKIHNIIYHDGIYVNGDNGIIKNLKDNAPWHETSVLYGESLTLYNKGQGKYYEPTVPEGFVFEGWYMDSEGNRPYTFSGTMPDKDIEIYAKWRQVQYRVLLHPQVPEDATNLSWGGQEMSFRVNEGEKIAGGNKIIGTTDNYEFIGWYTDPECTNSFEMPAMTLNDQTVTDPYDTTDDGVYNPTDPTELDAHGDPITQENKDATNRRYWITRKLELYGKWRAKLEGAQGIHVVYSANSGEVNGHFSGNETTYTDPLTYYKDRAEANAIGASVPYDTQRYQFMYWVIQRWDDEEGKYVDTDQHVYPGNTYEVLKAYARVEDIEDATDLNNSKRYTVHIRAEYSEAETPTPTHITWYANNGTGQKETNNDLLINEAVDIKSANTFSFPGYDFKGWARIIEKDKDGKLLNIPDDYHVYDPWLVYDQATNTFSVEQGGKTYNDVKQVFADEKLAYHGLVAVWEPKKFTVTVIKETESGYLPDEYNFNSEVFTFKPTFTGLTETTENQYQTNFTLVGDQTSASHTKVFTEVPYGTAFSMEELANEGNAQYYKTSYQVIRTTDDDGNSKNPSEVVISSNTNNDVKSYSGTVNGDLTITFTNRRQWGYLKIGKHFDVQEPYLDGVELEARWQNLEFTILNKDTNEYIKVKPDPGSATLGIYDGSVPSTTTPAPTVALSSFQRETGSSTHEHQYFYYVWVPSGSYQVTEDKDQADHLLPGYERVSAPYYKEATVPSNGGIHGNTNQGIGDADRIDNSYRGYTYNSAYLNVQKTVTGNAPKATTDAKKYSFVVRYDDLSTEQKPVYISGGIGMNTYTTNVRDANVFTLQPGGAIQLNGATLNDNGTIKVLAGGHYTVIELDSTTSPEAIEDPEIPNYVWTQGGPYQVNPVAANTSTNPALVIITNNYSRKTIDLIVKKRITGNMADLTKAFAFTAQLSGDDPGTFASGTGYEVDTGDPMKATFSLSHNGTVTLKDVPVGTTLTITEDPEDYTPSIASTTVTTGTVSSDKKTYTVTVAAADDGKTITFTNDKSMSPDTGVHMDMIPYFLILALCALGLEALRWRRVKGGM